MTTYFGGVDVVPLQGAMCAMVGGAFFLYIENTKIGFLLSGVYAGIFLCHIMILRMGHDSEII